MYLFILINEPKPFNKILLTYLSINTWKLIDKVMLIAIKKIMMLFNYRIQNKKIIQF